MRIDNLWSEAEDKRLAELFAQGVNDATIAKELGRPEGGIKVRRQKLRLLRAAHDRERLKVLDAMADYYPRWYREQLLKESRCKRVK